MLDNLIRKLRQEYDMVGLAVLLVLAQPLIPVGNDLARNDLVPWLTLAISVVALLRGERLGLGPHPMLTPRKATVPWALRRVAIGLVPWTLFAFYEAGRLLVPPMAGIGIGLCIAIGILLWLGGEHGRTAWNPQGIPSWLLWVSGVSFFAAAATGTGVLMHLNLPVIPSWTGPSLLISFGFLAIGLAAARVQDLRQRRAAGRKDGRSPGLLSFRHFLAFFGPGLGLFLLSFVYHFLLGTTLAFSQAFVASLFVVAWGVILWPVPEPIAVGCILHEVSPTGGRDSRTGKVAVAFDRPPEGALRFNPLRIKRTRSIHPWIVPIKAARIEGLDDPINPLWRRPAPLAGLHILGDAMFEPDRRGNVQYKVMTIRISNRDDVATVQGSDMQQRRIAILRPFARLYGWWRQRLATYRWEEGVPAETIQVVDASTEVTEIIDGDIIIMSAEGIPRAYEVEIGEPIYTLSEYPGMRPPQPEDYTEAG